MDDALLMRVVQRGAQLPDDVEFGIEGQRERRRHPRREAHTPQELHDDIGRRAFLGKLEHRDDVAMLQLRGSAGLPVKARPHLLFVFGEIDEHQLDRHLAIEHRIDAAKQHTHPTAADAFDDLIPSDLLGIRWSHFFLSLF